MQAEIDPELWGALVSLGRPRRLPAGACIFVEGDPPGDVFAVVRGRVKVSAVTLDGRERVLDHKQPGDLFGELSAIDGLPRSASASALDDVELAAIPGPAFVAFLHEHPVLALPLLQLLANRLRATTNQAVGARTRSTVARVAEVLITVAARDRTTVDGLPAVQASHEELAGWVGINREAVSRALGQLRGRGLVRTLRGRVVLLDTDALTRIG